MNDGKAAPAEIWDASPAEMRKRMLATDEGKTLMAFAGRGFTTEQEVRKFMRDGVDPSEVTGPRYKLPGIEKRRLAATQELLKTGNVRTYVQAISSQTGQMMKAERKGIFATKANEASDMTTKTIYVGSADGDFGDILSSRTGGTKDVHTIPGTTVHIQSHSQQFDVDKAQSLLPEIIKDPLYVIQGTKQATSVAVGEYDSEHFLIIPIKSLPNENWVETMMITNKKRFLRRKWVKDGMLYEKK